MATEQDLRKILDLMREAYKAGLHKKAARIAHQGAELAEAAGNIRRKVNFLFWEGENLRIFDNEQAMIPLLQAATCHPEADPADTYNAMTTLISISISTRPAAYTRKLLAQGREQLRRMGKEAWRHQLDFLEGKMETVCWNLQQAQVCYATAWEYNLKSPGYPGYTTASHLYKLCQNSFHLHDKAALAEWLAELEQCDKKGDEDDRLKPHIAQLLQQRLVGEAGEKMACLAQDVLKKTDSFEGIANEYIIPALRALILCRHWPMLDDRIAAAQWNEHDFADMLFRADERLLRALAALNLPMQDLELNPVLEITLPCSGERGQAERYLAQAEEFYRKAMSVAEKEDERLMVSAYTEAVRTRLEQAEKLHNFINEAAA